MTSTPVVGVDSPPREHRSPGPDPQRGQPAAPGTDRRERPGGRLVAQERACTCRGVAMRLPIHRIAIQLPFAAAFTDCMRR